MSTTTAPGPVPAASNGSSPSTGPRRIGTLSLILMIVAASAPLTVVAGGVTSNFAVTGSLGVPLSFLILGLVLVIFAVGYTAMSTRITSAGAFYSYVARGLGRTPGVGAAWVALVCYNAMQIGIYGMFGYATADLVTSLTGAEIAWWVWALIGWLIVGILGINAVDLSAKVLGILVALEFLVVLVFDVFGLADSPQGVDATGLGMSDLFGPGIGAVLAFSVAAFMGFESGSIYADEVKNPRVTVRRATYGAVIVIGIFYAFSAWAMIVGVGSGSVVDSSGANGPGVVFGVLAGHLPKFAVDIAQLLFVTSLIAALVSFHNVVSRYLRSLSRDRVLPRFLSYSAGAGKAPVAGSFTQSGLALVVLVIFAIIGTGAEDPIMFPVLTLFTWLTNMGALGLVALMALTSFAAFGFLRAHRAGTGVFTRVIAPWVAGVALAGMTILIIVNFPVLVDAESGSVLNWLLPAIVVVPGLVAAGWTLWLRSARPEVYEGIGHDKNGELLL
ncbi:MAG: APC family permease [Galactobacter sp.]|uniref:APC family permease n=1 Tax=Galactobacter sp. TaxID=2676125 RepID=UPI0025C1CEAB|nr:APC family permease [Galactobacter sp.]